MHHYHSRLTSHAKQLLSLDTTAFATYQNHCWAHTFCFVVQTALTERVISFCCSMEVD